MMTMAQGRLKIIRLRRVLELATTVTLLSLTAALLIILVWNHYHRGSTAQLRPGLRRNATLSQVKGIDYSTSAYTLIIALNTNCDSCAPSPLFHTRLQDLERDYGIRTVTIFPNPESEVKNYLFRTKLELPAPGLVLV